MKYFYKIGTTFCLMILFICSITTSIYNYKTQDYLVSVLDVILGIVLLYYAIKTLFKENSKRIKIIYHADIDKIKRINKGDWIDLRSAEDVILKKGEFKLISLGVSMKLPEGYEAHIVPRSSTYKNFKIIQTNHQAVIDNSFIRIVRTQPEVHFIETDKLDGVDRGGFGSTGKQ